MKWSTNGTFIWPTDIKEEINKEGHLTAIEVPTEFAMRSGISTKAVCELIAAAPDLVAALTTIKDRLSAWQESALIAYNQTGSEDQRNTHNNYSVLLASIDSALKKAGALEYPEQWDDVSGHSLRKAGC